MEETRYTVTVKDNQTGEIKEYHANAVFLRCVVRTLDDGCIRCNGTIVEAIRLANSVIQRLDAWRKADRTIDKLLNFCNQEV
jgi:hypothetical protein